MWKDSFSLFLSDWLAAIPTLPDVLGRSIARRGIDVFCVNEIAALSVTEKLQASRDLRPGQNLRSVAMRSDTDLPTEPSFVTSPFHLIQKRSVRILKSFPEISLSLRPPKSGHSFPQACRGVGKEGHSNIDLKMGPKGKGRLVYVFV